MKKTIVRIPLPKVAQKHNFDCGAAALKSVYEYENPDDINDISKYIKLLGSSEKDGTDTISLELACELLGLKVFKHSNMSLKRLEKEIDTGSPVLCLIRSNDHGHFVIAIGTDKENIYFEDPYKKKLNGFLKKQEFFERWTEGDILAIYIVLVLLLKPDISERKKKLKPT
jgi:predicted double-glycine peptidase